MNKKTFHSITQLFLVFILFSNQMKAESNSSFDFFSEKNTIDNIALTAICNRNTIVDIGQGGTSFAGPTITSFNVAATIDNYEPDRLMRIWLV